MGQIMDHLFPLPPGVNDSFRHPLTFWSRIQVLRLVLRPAWPSTLLSLAVAILLQVQQTREVFYSFVTEETGDWFPQEHLWGLLALLGFCVATWYFSRVSLYVRYWFTPTGTGESHEAWRRHFPRVIGTLPLLSAAVVFLRGASLPGPIRIRVIIVYALLTAGLVLFFVYRRRLWLSRDQHKTFSFSRLDQTWGRGTLWLVFGIEVICVILNVVFILSPVDLPQWFGPLAIILYAVTAWTAFGGFAVSLAYHRRWASPVIVMILYAALVGLWNNNHALDDTFRDAPKAERSTAEDHIRRWLDHRAPIWSASTSGKYPVFIVTAEGGGIRAAYWTASVLDQLQTRHAGFACHLLALSGVSGGSLGSAAFVAALADHAGKPPADPTFVPCRTEDRFLPAEQPFDQIHYKVLNRDFLGPVFAGALFPDAVQRFILPSWGQWTLPDRARFLEAAWEEAWADGARSGRFTQDFLSLWQTTPAPSPVKSVLIPSLFLNATWVETGGRAVISNVALSSPHFSGADDLLEGLCFPLKLSTAVHASARFTYISPAGTVEWVSPGSEGCSTTETRSRRVVDGGYFENSGAVTAEETLHLFNEVCSDIPGCDANVVPVVLILSNDYTNPNQGWETGPADLPATPPDSGVLLTGITSPVVTLFQTRSARGYYAEDHLREQAGRKNTIRLQLRDRGRKRPPLGWLLSQETRQFMDEQVRADPNLERLVQLLSSRAPSP
jgi:hypothetical protein